VTSLALKSPPVTPARSALRITILADRESRGARVRALLEPQHGAELVVIDEAHGPIETDVIIIAASLREAATVAALRRLLAGPIRAATRIFAIDGNERSLVVQAYSLGATDVVFTPFSGRVLRARLPRDGKTARSPRAPAVADCASALDAMFADLAVGGRGLDLQRAHDTTNQIVGSVAAIGLTAWIDDVRRHHQGTFQHCLLVAGLAVDFGMSLKFTGPDLLTLGLAATLHDIGKAAISLDILDKPGSLDTAERAIVERHPTIGYESVKCLDGLPTDVRDAVRDHHEMLDGSGYPRGLRGSEIGDLTRMVTIADVFAALIERRAYAPPMPRPDAFRILRELGGKLEQPLVTAFEPTALMR
jgi:putative nucleotidyltransferase with HDIG domain